jgi:hypothetical protein
LPAFQFANLSFTKLAIWSITQNNLVFLPNLRVTTWLLARFRNTIFQVDEIVD